MELFVSRRSAQNMQLHSPFEQVPPLAHSMFMYPDLGGPDSQAAGAVYRSAGGIGFPRFPRKVAYPLVFLVEMDVVIK